MNAAGGRHIVVPVSVEMRDVAEGLWLWRQPHPAWEEGDDWEPEVTSVAPLYLPELRGMLELPFEQVIVAHGEPLHSREDFIAALEREPWSS